MVWMWSNGWLAMTELVSEDIALTKHMHKLELSKTVDVWFYFVAI